MVPNETNKDKEDENGRRGGGGGEVEGGNDNAEMEGSKVPLKVKKWLFKKI